MLIWIATGALAGSGRLAVGLQTASGINPEEPTWTRQAAVPSAVGCVGAAGWWITGGHDYAGSRGEVLRTSDDERWGAAVGVCPTSRGGAQGTIGAAYGRQWGGQLYLTATSTVGLSGFSKRTEDGHSYGAWAPFAKPELALGLALPPGMTVEIGPYAMIAPPIVQRADVRPAGSFYGHFGLELTVLIGSASPQVPWRN